MPDEADIGGARTRWLVVLYGLSMVLVAVFARDRTLLYPFVLSVLTAGALLVGLWKDGRFTIRQVVIGGVLLRLAFFWIPPGLSDDAYRYVWDGIVQTRGINPYLYTPEELPVRIAPDLLGALNSPEYYSVYPPVSQLVFWIGGIAGGENGLVGYYIIKLLLLAAEIGGLLVLSRLAGARALLLYTWNPLVIVETAGQAHTESLAVLFLVGCVYLAQRKQAEWASVALTLAGWVKLYPFVLFPLLWRRFGSKTVWPAIAISVIVVAPYFDLSVPSRVASSLDLYVRYFEFNAGLYYGIKEIFLILTGTDVSKSLGPFMRGAFLATLPALYVLDRSRRWSLRQAFVWTIGAFFVLATTVHPWYLLILLALVVPARRPSWHWLWLGLLSMGTYLLYAGGPYWPFVTLGWVGWLALAVYKYRYRLLDKVQRRRAGEKAARIQPLLPASDGSLRILDLGAAEGYVGQALHRRLGADVVLADITDMNCTALPLVLYDGRHLPLRSGEFDVTILYFVLHHAEHPGYVLQEALRVSSSRVIVVESVYRSVVGHAWLRGADRLVNRLRAHGRMREQEEYLHFRTTDDWTRLFETAGARVVSRHEGGSPLHRQAFFALAKS